MQQHTGICRFTKDLDIFLSPADASKALFLLGERGFACEVCDPVWLAKAHRDGYFVDLITGMSDGTITVDRSWIERACPATVADVESAILASEELIASKLFVTRRERFDGADIAHIIFALRGKLHWNRILELAGEHWELILWHLLLFRYIYPAHSGYVPKEVWNNLLSRLSSAIGSPNPRARFRGSLIDPRIFAIDVDKWGLDDVLRECRHRRTEIRNLPDSRPPGVDQHTDVEEAKN